MFSSLITVLNIYHHFTIGYVNRTLNQISIICRRKNNQNLNKSQMTNGHCILLKRLQNLHKHLCHYYMIAYGTVWDFTTFLLLLASLPFNVICVLALANDQLSTQLSTAIGLIFLIHSFVVVTTLLTMAYLTETLHCSKKYLLPIIQQINIHEHWRLKLQLDDWFNRLNFGKKYGPFISNIGVITFNKVVEVIASKNDYFFPISK